ncbi:hypothetical protein K2X05_00475 [bacterium]|nr:hypothetical protein [bacterium]
MNIFLALLLMVSQVFAQNELTPNQQEYVKKSAEFNASYARKLKDLVILASEARKNDLMCEPGTYSSEIVKNAVASLDAALYADYEGKTVYKEIKMAFESNPAVMEVVGNKFTYRQVVARSESSNYDWNKIIKMAIVGSQFFSSGEGAYGSTRRVTILSETKVLVEEAEILNEEPWIKWNKKEMALTITEVNNELNFNFNGESYKMRWTGYDNSSSLVPASVPDENVPQTFEGVYFETESECDA